MKLQWGNSDPETNILAKTKFVELLASEDPETRTEAMERLGIAGEAELLPFLSDCLAGSYDELRSAAARVLTDMGDESVLFRLMDALSDRNFHVRYEARKAILAFEDSRPFIRLMQSYLGLQWDAGLAARVNAVEALGRLGDERAIPCLIGALHEADSSVCAAAVEALGMLGGEEAEKALVAVLNRSNSQRVRVIAERTLVRLRGEGAHEGLTESLRSSPDKDKVVSVRLEDLCRIADAMASMVHDMDNGKTKHLRIELDEIHNLVERWVANEEVLGGGCHVHRCGLCVRYGVVW